MQIQITRFPRLYDINAHAVETLDWVSFVQGLIHAPTNDKTAAPLFGPYALTGRRRPCTHSTSAPHKCDACVEALTLAVFDVDLGDKEAITFTQKLLQRDGVTHVFYSSYSFSPTHPAFRLVIPLSEPVVAGAWTLFRRAVIDRYSIPCNPAQCSAPSHTYFLPSCPPPDRRQAEPVVDVSTGSPLDISRFPLLCVSQEDEERAAYVPESDDFFSAAPQPITRAVAVNRLRARMYVLRAKDNPYDKMKADVIHRLVLRKPLAEHGARHTATVIATGILAYMFPDAAELFFREMLEPSIEAMRAQGSKMTWAKARRMLAKPLAQKRAMEAAYRERVAQIEAYRQQIASAFEATKTRPKDEFKMTLDLATKLATEERGGR